MDSVPYNTSQSISQNYSKIIRERALDEDVILRIVRFPHGRRNEFGNGTIPPELFNILRAAKYR